MNSKYNLIKTILILFLIIICFNTGSAIPLDIKSAKIAEQSKGNVDYSRLKFVEINEDLINVSDFSKTYIIKLDINNSFDNSSVFLSIPIPYHDNINLVNFKNNQKKVVKNGDLIKYNERPFQDPYTIFPLNINPGEVKTYYLEVSTNNQIVLPLTLLDKKSLYLEHKQRNLLFGAFAGIMAVMFLYNLIIFFFTNDKVYLFYILYLIGITSAQFSILGVSSYIFGNSPEINNMLLYLGSSLAGVFGFQFARQFLNSKEKLPKLDTVLKIVATLYGLAIIAVVFERFDISYKIIQANGLIGSLFLAATSITLALKGDRYGKFYSIAWLMLLIGMITYSLKDLGIIPHNIITNFMLPLGVVLETILLSIALADRINVLTNEKNESQAIALTEVKKNEELIKKQNTILEQKVSERTYELESTNKDLEGVLQNLKETQSQLLESEKMASIGQLTSGVAHEINNPINFVSANIGPLKRNISDILNILGEYQSVSEKTGFKEKLSEIRAKESKLDIKYSVQEIDDLINGIQEGASRTQEIVKGLKAFSRSDESEMKMSNINDGISSTMSILRSQAKGIQVKQNLDLNLPLVNCHLGKINQVILNILNNAIQAIEDRYGVNSSEGVLMIRSTFDKSHVYVQVEDNGYGIPEAARNKIFDPFFTTKEIGRGTGLGLSISYGVIEQHRGNLSFITELNVGTTFTIQLPIK